MPEYVLKDFADPLYSVNRRVARLRRDGVLIENTLTKQILMDQWNTQNGRCSCCGVAMDLIGEPYEKSNVNEMRVAVDKTDPVLGYVPTNITLMHQCCNRFKGTMNMHLVVAIANRIAAKYAADHPETQITIAEELSVRDNREYVRPTFSFTSAGGSVKFSGSAECAVIPNPPAQPLTGNAPGAIVPPDAGTQDTTDGPAE